MSNSNFQLQRDAYGRLVLTAENGERHEGVTPVRAFPIAAPDEGISLVNYEGHEVAWTDRLADLPPAIARRRTKGGMEGHIQAVLLKHRRFVQALLLEGELVRQGLIDRRKAEVLLRGPDALLASEAGELHILLATEAWLRHWS